MFEHVAHFLELLQLIKFVFDNAEELLGKNWYRKNIRGRKIAIYQKSVW